MDDPKDEGPNFRMADYVGRKGAMKRRGSSAPGRPRGPGGSGSPAGPAADRVREIPEGQLEHVF